MQLLFKALTRFVFLTGFLMTLFGVLGFVFFWDIGAMIGALLGFLFSFLGLFFSQVIWLRYLRARPASPALIRSFARAVEQDPSLSKMKIYSVPSSRILIGGVRSLFKTGALFVSETFLRESNELDLRVALKKMATQVQGVQQPLVTFVELLKSLTRPPRGLFKPIDLIRFVFFFWVYRVLSWVSDFKQLSCLSRT